MIEAMATIEETKDSIADNPIRGDFKKIYQVLNKMNNLHYYKHEITFIE